MARTIVVAAAQTGPVAEPCEAGIVEQAVAMIDEARALDSRLLVFPELFLSPFFANRLVERFERFFQGPDDAAVARIRAHAREAGVALVLPLAERAADGFFNTALVIDQQGREVGRYRKTHIPAYFPNERPGGTGSYEKFYFAPGRELPVFEVCGLRLGIQICNDRLYPEASRVLALAGADMIAMPIAFSTYADAVQRASIWEVPPRARAYENGLWVVACNRVGREGAGGPAERIHAGRSLVVDPLGMIRAEASGEAPQLLVAQVDLGEVERARSGLAWWRDRRPDLYGPLVR